MTRTCKGMYMYVCTTCTFFYIVMGMQTLISFLCCCNGPHTKHCCSSSICGIGSESFLSSTSYTLSYIWRFDFGWCMITLMHIHQNSMQHEFGCCGLSIIANPQMTGCRDTVDSNHKATLWHTSHCYMHAHHTQQERIANCTTISCIWYLIGTSVHVNC